MIWRIVAAEKIASLQELETHWSTVDLFRADLVCDFSLAQSAR